MTVTTELARSSHPWTGVETSFAPGFPADREEDVRVLFAPPTGDPVTLVPGVNHSVALATETKLITVTPINFPSPSGTVIVVRSTPALVQETLEDGEEFSLSVIQQLHDRAAMRSAEDRLRTDRQLSLTTGSEPGPGGRYTAQGGRIVNLAAGSDPGDAVTMAQHNTVVAAVLEANGLLADAMLAIEQATQLATPADLTVTMAKISQDTGSWWVDRGAMDPVIFRFPERVFIDHGAAFNGAWDGANMVGQSALAQQLHGWAPRDASLYVSSAKGAMSIVGHTQTSDRTGWPGLPGYTPAAIGVSGFVINDVISGTLGQAWGLYADAVRMPGAGFTVGMEIAAANLGDETVMTPYNVKSGAASGVVGLWLQSGGGLDAVAYPNPVNDIAAGIVLLSSFANGSTKMGKGLVFSADAVAGTDGATGEGTAIAFAKGHTLEWFNGSNQATTFIRGQANLSPNAVGLLIDDSGLNVVDRTGGVGLRIAPGANLANHLLIRPGVVSVSPTLEAEGSDTNIGIVLKPKGTGTLKFGDGAANLLVRPATTGIAAALEADGTDPSIDLLLKAKGSGLLQFGNSSAPAGTPSGFTADRVIFIKDGAGTPLAIPCRTSGW